MENEISQLSIEEIMARMAPPTIPDDVFDTENVELHQIVNWDMQYATMVLASLCTIPEYHANGIRLDWLQRLVLSKSNGNQKPSSRQFETVLNEGLSKAGVHRLEDPNEDLLCDLIATTHGNYRIFPGQWEQAAAYTQTLIEAFETLPNTSIRRDVLEAAHALLILSDVIASRVQVDRGTASGGNPFGSIQLPSNSTLSELSQRVKFSHVEIKRLGIAPDSLIPLILDTDLFRFVSDGEIGNTPLEFHPILSLRDGIVIISPNNISIAIRSILVNAALRGGLEKQLQIALMRRQEVHAEATGFWPIPQLNLSAPVKHAIRVTVAQYDEGSYLHVLQVPTTFEDFPKAGFATVRKLPQEVNQFIADDISRFWRFLEKQKDCRQSATVLLLSGWGVPHSFAPPVKHNEAPIDWQFIPLSFADAAVLGACDGGKFTDIVRLNKQVERLEKDGYSFTNPNGLLNMFGFFRMTDGNLIPEHFTDITQPTTIGMPTDELLKPRLEGIVRRDYRSLETNDGEYKIVQRTEWGKEVVLPIFASVDDLNDGQLSGAVSISGRTWWIESISQDDESREWRYQIWNAVLQWLGTIGPEIIKQMPEAFPAKSNRVQLEIPKSDAFERIPHGKYTQPLEQSIQISRSNGGVGGAVEIQESWLPYLQTPENKAEIELIASVLELLSESQTDNKSRLTLVGLISSIIGTKDWRWLHAFEANRPLERLSGRQLISRFKAIPLSASSLVKCQSVWEFWDRAKGTEFDGENACKLFLAQYKEAILTSLTKDIHRFNRIGLVTRAVHDYQSARQEQERWHRTIRALRAIRGEKANETAFARQNEINAVQRAAKIILEIGACEAPEDGAVEPSRSDMEELYAKVLLLVGNSQLFAAIRAGLIPSKIKLSPAGDLLTEREVFRKILEPGAEWLTRKKLDDASAEYVGRNNNPAPPSAEKLDWEAGLRKAVEAEFQVPAEVYFDLQFALTQLAEVSELSIIPAKHSGLVKILDENPYFPKADTRPLLQRLTLKRRSSWISDISGSDIDFGRFDRPFSLINRPLLMLDDNEDDPLVLVSPVLVSDSTMYSISGLMNGLLNNAFWQSSEARRFAGVQGNISGEKFETEVAERLTELGLETRLRCKLSALLNQKTPPELGDIDVLAITADKSRIWVIEAKNLRLCRTEAESAARMSEYRGQMREDSKGRKKPDKMLRHTQRVQYLRCHSEALVKTLNLPKIPDVRGLLIVDAPQPINFHMLDDLPDGQSAFLSALDAHNF
ncbi:MAG: hypothetical protein GY748_24315 [Planctomycetaceae bacterium]|nr:hypothetical protein [Planctomycetaceae bacterium]